MSAKAIILAAGKGTRMKSDTLKVLHHVAGKPILQYVIDTVFDCGVSKIYLVVGHQQDLVREIITDKRVTFVEQKEQLGTGHAVVQVAPFISKDLDAPIFVLAGDCPLIECETLQNLLAIHKEANSHATVLTAEMEDPAGYGRILRGQMGTLLGIKEAKDCTRKELAIKEINTGVYVFQSQSLFQTLKRTGTANKQGEYYLTDVIHLLKENGESVRAWCTENYQEAIGINTRIDLSQTNKILYEKINRTHMLGGVTIISPENTFIDSTVAIGQDTIVHPFTTLAGNTVIGRNCVIGPYAYVKNASIRDDTLVEAFSKST